MTRIVNVLGTLRKAEKQHFMESIYWLLFTIFGSGLPVYGGWFLLALLSIRVGFTDFCRHGEFALYSAAILGSTLHLISKGGYKNMIINMRCFVLVSFVLLLFATLIFAGATAASATDVEKPNILNLRLLIPSSVILLVLTIVVAFIVNLVDNVILSSDLSGMGKKSLEKLNQDFEKTGG